MLSLKMETTLIEWVTENFMYIILFILKNKFYGGESKSFTISTLILWDPDLSRWHIASQFPQQAKNEFGV